MKVKWVCEETVSPTGLTFKQTAEVFSPRVVKLHSIYMRCESTNICEKRASKTEGFARLFLPLKCQRQLQNRRRRLKELHRTKRFVGIRRRKRTARVELGGKEHKKKRKRGISPHPASFLFKHQRRALLLMSPPPCVFSLIPFPSSLFSCPPPLPIPFHFFSPGFITHLLSSTTTPTVSITPERRDSHVVSALPKNERWRMKKNAIN